MIKSREEQLRATAVICYEMTTTNIDAGEDMRYTTYGIKALDEDHNTVVEYVDVNTNRALVELIVDKCNRHRVDTVHLEDVILDSIG